MIDLINKLVYNPINEIIHNFNPVNVVELAIIGFITFIFYFRFIRGTSSERFVKGIIFLLASLVLSKILILLDLQILGKFIETIVSIVLFALVVIFQPELRRLLGYLGQPGFLSKNMFNMDIKSESTDFIDEITGAIKYLSKSRTGALIVLQENEEGANYFEVGTKINGNISTELILTIFHPNTALHDGAMVIFNDKILSAGVLLPLTEDPKLSWQYGTRHRAAIGMSEASDAFCIVVSEETGNVSIAHHGVLKKMESIEELKHELQKIFGVSDEVSEKPAGFKLFNFNNFFNKKNSNKIKKA